MIVDMLFFLTVSLWLPAFAADVMFAKETDRRAVVLWSAINLAINMLFIYLLDVLTWGRDHLYLFVVCPLWGQQIVLTALQLRLKRHRTASIWSTVTALLVSVSFIGLFWLFNWVLWH